MSVLEPDQVEQLLLAYKFKRGPIDKHGMQQELVL
jgi:hypothetical protein